MSNYINKNNIIEAYISEPYENCNESWDVSESHGWRLVLVIGFQNDGTAYGRKLVIENPYFLKEDYFFLILINK